MHVERFIGREQGFVQRVGRLVGGESGEGVVAGARGVGGDVVKLAAGLLGDRGEGGCEFGVGFHVDDDGG